MVRSHLAAAVVLLWIASVGTSKCAYGFDQYQFTPWRSYDSGSWETIPLDFQPTYDEGYSVGYPIGYKWGFGDGQVLGRNEGWTTGKSAGHGAGWNEAYPLAFDLGYDEAYPAAHRSGWDDGLGDGFEEGYEYAPQVAAQILNYWNGGGGAYSGSLTISSGNTYFGNAGILAGDYWVWRDAYNNDWAKISYDEGYKSGHSEGYSDGSSDGYDVTYPVAYAAAFPIGHQLGIWEGTSAGKREGSEQGREVGWDDGYDLGWDEGFYAGIDYHIFGEFLQPQYSLQYTRRSDALSASSLVAMNAPEPGSLAMIAMAGAMVAGARRRRG